MFFRMFWMFWIFQIFWIYQIFRMFLNIFEIDFWNTSKYIKNLISSLFLSLRFWRKKIYEKIYVWPPTHHPLRIFSTNFFYEFSSTNFLYEFLMKTTMFFLNFENFKILEKKNFGKIFFGEKNNQLFRCQNDTISLRNS